MVFISDVTMALVIEMAQRHAVHSAQIMEIIENMEKEFNRSDCDISDLEI